MFNHLPDKYTKFCYRNYWNHNNLLNLNNTNGEFNIILALRNNYFEFDGRSSIPLVIKEVESGIQAVEFSSSRETAGCSMAPPSQHSLPPASACSLFPAVLVQAALKSTAQQTDISCSFSTEVSLNAVSESELQDARGVGAVGSRDPHPAVCPPPVQMRPSASLLSSVCALLVQKQSGSKSGCGAICRICLAGDSTEQLLRPCACRGTAGAVHRSCLQRWLLRAVASRCEICRHHYVVLRTHKWSLLRSVVEWVRAGGGRALAGDAGRALALGTLSVAGTARALHACERTLHAGARAGGSGALLANVLSSLVIGIIGALNGLLTTWMLLKIQEHQMSWQTWREGTINIEVILSRESVTEEVLDQTITTPASHVGVTQYPSSDSNSMTGPNPSTIEVLELSRNCRN